MNGGSFCSMNIMQHLTAWQSLFVATTPGVVIVSLVLALLFIGFLYKQSEIAALEEIRFLHFKNRNIISSFFDPLRLAFSKGILHSKRYAFVSVA